MKSTVSVRWQTVIPQEVREALEIEPNTKIEWEVKNGYAIVYPLPSDPIGAARGMFKGSGLSEDLMAARRRERALETERERLLGVLPRKD
jgi:AbrB family looped-hinge helix DNA binding protein